jgi:mRNA interferase MazF
MGNYSWGDVVIAPVACEERGGVKTRPAVVLGMTEKGDVYLCPVSSKPPSDAPCVSISLDDFSEGGLDLFNESYVLTSRVRMIRSGDVMGKRGRLTQEAFQAITSRAPQSYMPDNTRKKGNGHYHSLR